MGNLPVSSVCLPTSNTSHQPYLILKQGKSIPYDPIEFSSL